METFGTACCADGASAAGARSPAAAIVPTKRRWPKVLSAALAAGAAVAVLLAAAPGGVASNFPLVFDRDECTCHSFRSSFTAAEPFWRSCARSPRRWHDRGAD